MYRWNTQKLVEAFEAIPQVSSVKVDHPGGDCDTENIVLFVEESDDERVYCCGFSCEDESIWDTPYEEKGDINIEMVELTDGMDSRGGLNSSNPNTAMAYIAARQILVDDGAHVVNRLKDYF